MPLSRNDKKLHITFNEMGHGDNVLISLPNGKMVVIDCGSMRWDGNFWNPKQQPAVLRAHALNVALGDERFLLNVKEIDILILTHPDEDHCAELGGLFVGTTTNTPATKVKRAYFSHSLSQYDKHGVPFNLINMKKADELYSITLNQSPSTYFKVPASKTTVPVIETITASANNTAEILKKSRIPATQDFVKILDGSSDDGIECGVYVLASNVNQYTTVTLNDSSSQDNRGSIVTMIIYGDKKFLFMGDSTFNTEYFLMQTYGARIQNVELLHIPHHASFTTSSSYPGHPPAPPNVAVDFVAHVNPRYAVITAAYDAGPQLALPRYEVIDRYHGGGRLLNKPNDVAASMKKISCYQKQTILRPVKIDKFGKVTKTRTEERNVLVDFNAPKHLWCTGSHGPIDFDYEKKGVNTTDQV